MKVDLLEKDHHWCFDGQYSKGTTKFFSEEEKEAIEYLKQKGVSFSLVDLSESSFKDRLLARINGIDKTPIVLLDNGSKLKGIEQVKEHF